MYAKEIRLIDVYKSTKELNIFKVVINHKLIKFTIC